MKKVAKVPVLKVPVFESTVVDPSMWGHGIAWPLKDGKRAVCGCGEVVRLKAWKRHQEKGR